MVMTMMLLLYHLNVFLHRYLLHRESEKENIFLFLAYPPPQIDVQREIKADADFLCQFLLELNISMDPSIVLCNVFFARIQYQYTMDPSIVLCNVFAHRLLYL